MLNTTTDLSPSELAECRANLKRQWENRKIDQELIRCAWRDALRVATVLYEEYDASKVAVFGSLTIPLLFSRYSDIDISVWDIPDNKFREIRSKIDGLNCKFKIGLINILQAKGLIRERIKEQRIVIKKGETDENKVTSEVYSVNPMDNHEYYKNAINRFILRIKDDHQIIQDTIKEIIIAMKDIEDIPTNCRIYIKKVIANDFLKVYNCVESIFRRIARVIDMSQPPGSEYPNDPDPIGSDWAYELILQMGEKQLTRPAVITPKTTQRLQRFLNFCAYHVDEHKMHDLFYDEAEKHAKRVSKLFDNVSKELEAFTAFLRET